MVEVKAYNLYGSWGGTRHILSTNNRWEVWSAIKRDVRFGEDYEVRDENDRVLEEFAPRY